MKLLCYPFFLFTTLNILGKSFSQRPLIETFYTNIFFFPLKAQIIKFVLPISIVKFIKQYHHNQFL